MKKQPGTMKNHDRWAKWSFFVTDKHNLPIIYRSYVVMWWSYWRVTSAAKYFTFRDESGAAGIEREIMDICKKVSQLLSTSNWIILATRILLPLVMMIIMSIWGKMMIVRMTGLTKVTKGLNRRQLDWEGSLLQRDVLSVPRDFDTRQDTSRGQHGALRL